ncbi:RING-H2 finger protein ATL40-like [Punica granatum]|uniref:RING-type E3 ubiquitin transferase n=1 Tax=Punica granatum TaxID=22663 RepID=A0A6P8D6W0_PUNGR|nr:RING-H2 finger protein ATL40-like [Punica granatum]
MDDGQDDNFRPIFPHRSNPYDLNSKIMLTAIVSLMIVVVLVVILHVYARCIMGRQARRRAALHSLSLRVARLHSAEQEPTKAGLDPAVIPTLPVFKFKGAGNGDEEEPVRPECAVCLSSLEDEDMVRLLPNCNHIFHPECIDMWLSSHTTCPICRTEAKPQLQSEPREPPSRAPAQPQLLNGLNANLYFVEGTSDGSAQALNKSTGGSSSRFNSFRRILTRERSSQRIQSCGLDDDIEDPESQRL